MAPTGQFGYDALEKEKKIIIIIISSVQAFISSNVYINCVWGVLLLKCILKPELSYFPWSQVVESELVHDFVTKECEHCRRKLTKNRNHRGTNCFLSREEEITINKE